MRLSYIFENDDGFRTGITTRWLLPAPDPAARTREWTVNRPAVLLGDTTVGNLNPIYGRWWSYPHTGTEDEPALLSAGALTCSFILRKGMHISDQFRFRSEGITEPVEKITGADVSILGDSPAGTVLDELEYMEVEDKKIFPLLRLLRSPTDLLRTDVGIRNGAMVTTASAALVGVIIGLSKDGRVYSVAPIADVLERHQLKFLTRRERSVGDNELVAVSDLPVERLPENLNPKIKCLVDA